MNGHDGDVHVDPAADDGRSDADSTPPTADADDAGTSSRRYVPRGVVAEALVERDERVAIGLPADDAEPMPVVVEVNLRHRGGVQAAHEGLRSLLADVGIDEEPWRVAETYYRFTLTLDKIRELVRRDRELHDKAQERIIYRIWPDYPVRPLIDRSTATVKADAALAAYSATGEGITWAVVDSGVQADHPHFARHGNLTSDEVVGLHRDFTQRDEPADSALVDETGHGTHVAGIIAGGLPADPDFAIKVGQHEQDEDGFPQLATRDLDEPARLAGVAPQCRIVSLKALPPHGTGDSTGVMRALAYIRELNGEGKLMRIHGVNLSVGYEFRARWFACGQSPLCVEVNRLVRSGVVVVIAAGNTGYGTSRADEGSTPTGLALTINDPGNADSGITVGATHRDAPYTYGVSYFSSKGPTGDGRQKPDLVAPGENITSCAVGDMRGQMFPDSEQAPPLAECATYNDRSGTSMAAPHVSGAIAAFLSIRREFIGQPERVKQIFLDTASSLDRTADFQGRGLVDLMRAIQSV